MNSIVCAFDGSDCAMRAAEMAVDLAGKYDAKLSLVYVVEPYAPPVDLPGVSFIDWIDPMRKAGARMLADASDALSKKFGIQPETEIRIGSPPNEIVQYASEKQAMMIVVGSRGLGTMKRLLIGSVADRVVHLAHTPVLVVR